jgi:hypothetical protein
MNEIALDYTQTGGGGACAFGAGLEHGMKEKGLRQYIGRGRAYSGGLLNQAVGIAGKTDDLLNLYKEVMPNLIDKVACGLRLVGLSHKPIVNLDALHSVMDGVLDTKALARLRAHPHPLFALASARQADNTYGPIEYLDVRDYGVAALKATSCITSCVTIGDRQYTDPGFHQPFHYNRWNTGVSLRPELLVINRGKPSRDGRIQAAAFFRAQFGKNPDAEIGAVEHHALRKFYKLEQLGKPILRLRARTPISFSTTNPGVIEDAFEEGYLAADRVADFISMMHERKAA